MLGGATCIDGMHSHACTGRAAWDRPLPLLDVGQVCSALPARVSLAAAGCMGQNVFRFTLLYFTYCRGRVSSHTTGYRHALHLYMVTVDLSSPSRQTSRLLEQCHDAVVALAMDPARRYSSGPARVVPKLSSYRSSYRLGSSGKVK